MLRFLSKRFRRRDGVQPLKDRKETEQQQLQKTKHSLFCKILLLDGTDLSLFMRKKALGEELFSRVCDHIGLQTEFDYFGLQYTDTNSQSHWLDNTKEIRKQVNIGPPYTFRFKVKFYCCDPNTLRDEFIRYLFFLQVSQLNSKVYKLTFVYFYTVKARHSKRQANLCPRHCCTAVSFSATIRVWWFWRSRTWSHLHFWVSIRTESRRRAGDENIRRMESFKALANCNGLYKERIAQVSSFDGFSHSWVKLSEQS